MSTRKQQLVEQLRVYLGELGGQDLSDAPPSAPFLDLGFDSLFLTQAATGMKSRFGVKLTFRQLLETLTSMEAVANYLDEQLPTSAAASPSSPVPQVLPKPTAPVAEPTPSRASEVVPGSKPPSSARANGTPQSTFITPPPVVITGPSPARISAMERVVQEQLRLMEHQLALLRQGRAIDPIPEGVSNAPTSEPHVHVSPARSVTTTTSSAQTPAALTVSGAETPTTTPGQHGPFRQIDKTARGGLSEIQQKHLDWLIPRYLEKSPRSRDYTQQFRNRLADPRAVAGFKQNWKAMVYPIVTTRSSGAHLWDVDGRCWVDVTMGFGVALLGHSPSFITEAVRKQLDLGVEIGPQSPLAGEVAELICEFTGMERVTFCNTGSEAVMAALRICRTVTGRNKIVLFSGAYHGTFDEVLVKGVRVKGEPKTLPIAPGIAPNLIESTVVLDYGTQESLDWIRQHADTLAAVLVETVQSRHPDLQPKAFLQELRAITKAVETPLIFDEVITGFRCHPGGAQKYFGIEADLATYGKIVGGGMPFGFIAGKSWLMDAFDGGAWNYGDDSFPPTGVTFFAGTFVRHPLAMAAAKAMLLHLREKGPSLQADLAQRTDRLLGGLNNYFKKHQIPLHLEHFTSLWYPHWEPEVKHGSLLFFHLREKGLHIWEGRPCFLSTAHTEEHEAFIEQAFKQSIAEMQQGGFLSGTSDPEFVREAQSAYEVEAPRLLPQLPVCPVSSFSVLRKPETQPESPSIESGGDVIPLTEGQKEMWLSAQLNPESSGTFNASCVLELKGELDVVLLEQSIHSVVHRHEALRARILSDGSGIQIQPTLRVALPRHDLQNSSDADREKEVERLLKLDGSRLFSLEEGPLFQVRLIQTSPGAHLFVFTVNMIVCDGWGINGVLEEMGETYSASRQNRAPSLKPLVPLRAYVDWLSETEQQALAAESGQFWLQKLTPTPAPLELPASNSRPSKRTVKGARETLRWDPGFSQQIRDFAKAQGTTPFAVLFATYQTWLFKLTGQSDLVIGVPCAGQSTFGRPSIVNQCVQTLPVRAMLNSEQSFTTLLQSQRSLILEAQENWNCSFGSIAQKLHITEDPRRLPLVSVLFNLDPPMTAVRFAGLECHISSGPRSHFQYELGLNVVDEGSTLVAEVDYNSDLFASELIADWLTSFNKLLELSMAQPGSILRDLPMWISPQMDLLTESYKANAGRPPAQTTPRPQYIAPRTPTEKVLATLWTSVLQVPDIGVRDNFFELGGQSLKAVALFARIQNDFGRKLPLATLLKSPTIEGLATILDGVSAAPGHAGEIKGEAEAWNVLVPLQTLGKHPPLFLVHGAGGNVLLYQALARRLAPDYPLFGLQSHGLDGKTPPLRSIEEMARMYLREIRRVQPHGPYLIGGYCMGGTIAYEMAQQLRGTGETVALLALLDTYNFALMQEPGTGRFLLQKLFFHLRNFAKLRPQQMLNYLSEKARVARDGEWASLFSWDSKERPVGRDDQGALREPAVQEMNDQACLAYQPKPYDGVVTQFKPEVNYDFYPDPLMGWGGLARGGIKTLELMVNPHAMLVEPFVEEFAALLKSRIDVSLDAAATRTLKQAA